jgi:hypothetical protein
MANIPIDPRLFVPRGFEILHVPGRNALKRVVVARRPKVHEEFGIVTISPFPPGQVPFANVAEILQDFLVHVQVGFRDIEECPLGAAYVRFSHVCDRYRLIHASPIPFGDVHVSFCKHNEGVNWRRFSFNRECWLLLVGPPLDYRFTEDLNAVFQILGSCCSGKKMKQIWGGLLPKLESLTWKRFQKAFGSQNGDMPDSESWTFSVEILQEELLGGGASR